MARIGISTMGFYWARANHFIRPGNGQRQWNFQWNLSTVLKLSTILCSRPHHPPGITFQVTPQSTSPMDHKDLETESGKPWKSDALPIYFTITSKVLFQTNKNDNASVSTTFGLTWMKIKYNLCLSKPTLETK